MLVSSNNSNSLRRPTLDQQQQQHQQFRDENTFPSHQSVSRSAASPAKKGTKDFVGKPDFDRKSNSNNTESPASTLTSKSRSPSKLPTLSDIAARLNRDKESAAGTPTSPTSSARPPSPNKVDARARLELTGRIIGSPRLHRSGSESSPLSSEAVTQPPRLQLPLPSSPSKLTQSILANDDKSSFSPAVSMSPSQHGSASGSSSPTKRLLAKGLPSLDEIRDRMAKKGLCKLLNDHSENRTISRGESRSDFTAKNVAGSPSKAAVVRDNPPSGCRSDETTVPLSTSLGVAPLQSTESGNGNAAMKEKCGCETESSASRPVSTSHSINHKKVRLPASLPTPPQNALADECNGEPKNPDRSSYPLQHEWTLFYDTKPGQAGVSGVSGTPGTPGTPGSKSSSPYLVLASSPNTSAISASSATSWEANLRTIGSYRSVETFLSVFSTLHRPSQLDKNSNYHLFKDNIKPMWEDPRNATGGKWSLTFHRTRPSHPHPSTSPTASGSAAGLLLDRSWMWLVLGLIGEVLDENDFVTGAVCSVKPRADRISVWVRNRFDIQQVNQVGKHLISLLELDNEAGISLEFQPHSSSYPATSTAASGTLSYSISSPIDSSFCSLNKSPPKPNGNCSKTSHHHSCESAAATDSSSNIEYFSFHTPLVPPPPNGARTPHFSPSSFGGPPVSGVVGSTAANLTSNIGGGVGASLGHSLGLGLGLHLSPSSSSSSSASNVGTRSPGKRQRTLLPQTNAAQSWRSNNNDNGSTNPFRSPVAMFKSSTINAADARTGTSASTLPKNQSLSPLRNL